LFWPSTRAKDSSVGSLENLQPVIILWVLYTGMQLKCLPISTDAEGKPTIHYTNVYRVFAKWAHDGSLWQAFLASV
jgi:hypothetical protein